MLILRGQLGRALVVKLATRALFSSILISVSLRDYLFGNGLYIYRDWSWPLSSRFTPVSNFSTDIIRNSSLDPLGFTRSFLTWPIVFIDMLSTDVILNEKLFVIYLFGVLVSLSFLFSTILLRVLNRHSTKPLSGRRGEVFVLFSVLFSFANMWSIQQLAGLYYSYVIDFFLVSIAIGVIMLGRCSMRSILLAGGLTSACIFLDPNMWPYGLLAISLVILISTLSRSISIRGVGLAVGKALVPLAVSIPPLVTMAYILTETTTTSARPAGAYLLFTANLSIDNAIRLLGYSWSLVAYSPPSILWGDTPISQLPVYGFPPFMILPGGLIEELWIASTWLVPVVAFLTAFLYRYRTLVAPVSLVALASLLLTQPRLFPYPYMAATSMHGVPIVGGAIVTVFAIPDHALLMLACSYLILIPVFVHAALSEDDLLGRIVSSVRHANTRIPRSPDSFLPKVIRVVVPLFLMALLLLPSWQLFSGSFYPSGFADTGIGNGLTNAGAFSPSTPPPEMFNAYTWLISRPGNSNVYWPGPNGATYPWSQKSTPSITFIDSPKPTFLYSSVTPFVFPDGLKYLIQANLTSDAASYLAALNVQYLVVQPLSQKGMIYSWGINDESALVRFLESSPGISKVFSQGEISVFEVNATWGKTYVPNLVIAYGGPAHLYVPAYAVLSSLGIRPAIMPQSRSDKALCIDTQDCTISIISPANLTRALTEHTTFTIFSGPASAGQNLTLAPGGANPLPAPWTPWALTNWGSVNAEVQISEDALTWSFDRGSTTLTLSYNGTLTNNSPGGISVPPNSTPTVHVKFSYRGLGNTLLSVLIPALNSNLITQSIASSTDFIPSGDWKDAQFDVTLPRGISMFTSRIQAKGITGWVEIRDVTMEVDYLNSGQDAPFGFTTPIDRSIEYVIKGGVELSLEYRGGGSISLGDLNIDLPMSHNLSWYSVPVPANVKLTVSRTLEIACLVMNKIPLDHSRTEPTSMDTKISVRSKAAVVFASLFSPGYALRGPNSLYKPLPTLDGMNLFDSVEPGTYELSFPSAAPMSTFYYLSLDWIFALVLFTSLGLVKRRKSPRLGFGPKNNPRKMLRLTIESGLHLIKIAFHLSDVFRIH